MTETWDYKTVKYVFLCFLIISFVLAAESSVHYFIEPDTPETADILATIFVHLIPCIYSVSRLILFIKMRLYKLFFVRS